MNYCSSCDYADKCVFAYETMFCDDCKDSDICCKTKIIKYGPVFVDNVQPPTDVSYTFTEIDFSDYKIDKTIEKFINDPKFRTTQVTIIDREDALDRITDLKEFL